MADTTDYSSLISGGLNALGTGYLANQATNAANTAAQMSQFRPVGVTSRFGKSGFTYDPTTGALTGAGYQVAPDVAAMREGLLGLAGTGLTQAQQAQAFQPGITQAAQGLFNLGQGYLAQTPQQAAQDWMSKQQQLLAPGREQQLAQLENSQFQKGRTGLATGATTAGYTAGSQGLAASNPQMAAYYNAMAQQDANLAANAMQQGQAQTTFGQGLLTGGISLANAGYGMQTQALAPYTTYLQGAQTAENLGQGALTTGASLGSSAAQAGAQAAQQYMQGQQAQQAALQGAISGLTDPISQLIQGLSGSSIPALTAASGTTGFGTGNYFGNQDIGAYL